MKGLALALAAALLVLPLARYGALHSNLLDLGVFQNQLFRMGALGEWTLAFTAHSSPVSIPYAAVYAALPEGLAPYALLGWQALLLLTPVPWLHRRGGTFAALAYMAYVPLWINAHFDFHFDHLAVPLLLGFYAALAARRIGWAVAAALALLAVKEPFALQTAACGVLLIVAALVPGAVWDDGAPPPRGRLVAAGVALAVAGLAYFDFTLRYVLPYFAMEGWQGALGNSAFSWLGRDPAAIALAVVMRPHEILADVASTPGKLAYLGVVFGTLGFVPLLRPALLIPALPPLAIALLARFPNYYDYNTHYTAGLIVPVMAAFLQALPHAAVWWGRMAGRFAPRRATFGALLLAWMLLGHVMLSPSPASRLFWSEKIWSYSWRGYVPSSRDAMIKKAIEQHVPAGADVAVSTQNTLNWHRLTHRRVVAPFPFGTREPLPPAASTDRSWSGFLRFVASGEKPATVRSTRHADYVLVDLRRPYFLVDRGCEWVHGACHDGRVEQEFRASVAAARLVADTVFEEDGFLILRRRAS